MIKRKVRTDALAIMLGIIVLVPLASWRYVDRLLDEKYQALEVARKAENQHKDCFNTAMLQLEELEHLRKIGERCSVYNPELINALNPAVDPHLATVIMRQAIINSENHGLHPLLVLSLIYTESQFNPMATSRAGAKGLMQVLPAQHKERLKGHRPEDLYGIKFNIEVGCEILAGFIKSSNGNLLLALNRYLSMNAPPYMVATYQRDIVYGTMLLLLKHEESCRQ